VASRVVAAALAALVVVGSFCCRFVMIVSLRAGFRSGQERQGKVLECGRKDGEFDSQITQI